MKDELKKQKTLATISALNTILERYPKLLNWDSENGVETSFTAISFLMDILKMFGITEESILEWLTTLISGTQEGGVEKGILFAINEAIKDTPGINKPKLIKLFGKSRATVERAIAELVSASRIEHRGSNKTGGYYPL